MIGSGLTLPVAFSRGVLAADKSTLVNSLRSLSNPYHAAWNKGGEAFAKAMGLDYLTLVTEGDSEKGSADIRAMPAKTGGNAVVNIDPNDAADAPSIVEACAKAGAHLVTQWNKPAELHPWDFDPNYVAQIAFDGVLCVEATAKTQFGHRRQGRHSRPWRPAVQYAGDRAQGWPRQGAGRSSGHRTSGFRLAAGSPPRPATSSRPGSPALATRRWASGRPTTTWRSVR